jgi:predicted transcriptional regulator
MNEEVLENLGLTTNEAKVYQALLEVSEGSIWDIAKQADIHRRNAYDVMKRLIDRGLAYEVLPKEGRSHEYAPVHPEKLEEVVQEKMKDLESVMPALSKKFEDTAQDQSIYIYEGVGGLKNFIRLIIEETPEDGTIHGIGSKGTWFDSRLQPWAKRQGEKLESQNIESKLIYDEDIKNHTEVIEVINGPFKFLPEKYTTGSSIDIFGDYVAVYSGVNIKQLQTDITIFILKDKTLAKDAKKWWQFMWDHLPEETREEVCN